MSKRRYYEQPSGEDLVYIEFDTEQGRVVTFSVQYVAFIEGRWWDVKRFDTAHGRLHVHRFWLPHDRQVEELENVRPPRPTYDVDLREVILDIKENWKGYRDKVSARVNLDPWIVHGPAHGPPQGGAR